METEVRGSQLSMTAEAIDKNPPGRTAKTTDDAERTITNSPPKSGGRWLLVLGTIPFLLLILFVGRMPHLDFYYFYYAFHVVWAKLPNHLLYNVSAQHQWFIRHNFRVYPYNQYLYPPQFAVLFSPLGSLPVRVAEGLWVAMSALAYFVGMWLLFPLVHPRKNKSTYILFFLVILLNGAFWWDLTIGNANWLVFFTIALGLYLRYVKNAHWLAGIPIGLSIAFKVSPGIILLYFILYREWKFIISAFFTVVLSTVLSVQIIGVEPFRYYVLNLSHMASTSMQNGFAPYNSSLIGVLEWWNHTHLLPLSATRIHLFFMIYLVVLTGVLCVLSLQRKYSSSGDFRVTLALGLLTVLLYAPLVEGPHLMIAYAAAWLLFGAWFDNWKPQRNKPSARRSQAGLKVAFTAAFLTIWVVLSPMGWVLRSSLPSEYFYTLMVLTVLAITLSINTPATKGKPGGQRFT